MAIVLKDTHGKEAVATENESSNINFSLRNGDQQIDKASLISLLAILYDWTSKKAIGDWWLKDILDANGGTVSDDGDIVLRLQAQDNIIVSPTLQPGRKEKHRLRLFWAWNDGVQAENRTGVEELEFSVEELSDIIPPGETTTTTAEP
jgi:hypothetical protein